MTRPQPCYSADSNRCTCSTHAPRVYDEQLLAIHTFADGIHASTTSSASTKAHGQPSGGALYLAMLCWLLVGQQHDRCSCRHLPLAPAHSHIDSVKTAGFQAPCLQDWLMLLPTGTVTTVAVVLRPGQSLG
jgi:hypothetical protein